MLETLVLDNETIVRLIENLKQFASDYRCSGRSASYVLYKSSLLHEDHLARNPALVAKIINRHRKITEVELPFVADRIETKTNARIFGFKTRDGRMATVKILMRHSGRTFATRKFGRSLFAEIHARRLAGPALARAGRLYAPRLFDYDRQHGRWLVEEYVPGTRAKRQEAGVLLPRINAGAVYAAAARMRPLLRRSTTRKWVEWLTAIDPDFPRPEKDAVWPEALIHSDLRGNLHCTPDGRLFVLDWELSRVAPVAADAASIYYLNPGLKPHLVAWLRHLDPEGKAPAPEVQIGLALMRFTSEMMQNPAQYLADLMKEHRISYESAAALVEEDKKGIRDHLAFLLAK